MNNPSLYLTILNSSQSSTRSVVMLHVASRFTCNISMGIPVKDKEEMHI
jgi:hypothetical protein